MVFSCCLVLVLKFIDDVVDISVVFKEGEVVIIVLQVLQFLDVEGFSGVRVAVLLLKVKNFGRLDIIFSLVRGYLLILINFIYVFRIFLQRSFVGKCIKNICIGGKKYYYIVKNFEFLMSNIVRDCIFLLKESYIIIFFWVKYIVLFCYLNFKF